MKKGLFGNKSCAPKIKKKGQNTSLRHFERFFSIENRKQTKLEFAGASQKKMLLFNAHRNSTENNNKKAMTKIISDV